MARRSTPERSRSLVPVSGVGVGVDEVKTGGNAENSRAPRSDMVAGSLKYLGPIQVHWMNCAKRGTLREKCAHACVR